MVLKMQVSNLIQRLYLQHISKRLGLKESILERAKSLIDNDNICIEDLLKEIYDNQIEIEKKKDETTKNLNQIEMLRKKLETDYSEYEEKAILMVENAKKEARDILLDVQDEATQIIKEMNNLSCIVLIILFLLFFFHATSHA